MRLLPWLVAGLVFVAWWVGSAFVSPVLLPSPLDVSAAVRGHGWTLLEACGQTALAALLGLALALVFGLGGAVAFLWSRTLELAFYPYAVFIQTLPIVAVAPLLVVWLGYGLPVAVVSAAIVAFFPVLTSAHVGLRAASPEQIELMRLYGATRWQELWSLRLPGAMPYLLAGVRTAGGLAVIGAIVGEFVGSNGLPPSLGHLVVRSARSADTGLTFAAVGAAAALALGLFVAVRSVERRWVSPWHGDRSG